MTAPAPPQVVALTGEVDHHAAPAFRGKLFRAMRDGESEIVVDLSEATFLDSATLGVLLDARKRLVPSGRALSLVCREASILRLFEITALDRLFEIHPTLAAALDRKAAVGGAVASGDLT